MGIFLTLYEPDVEAFIIPVSNGKTGLVLHVFFLNKKKHSVSCLHNSKSITLASSVNLGEAERNVVFNPSSRENTLDLIEPELSLDSKNISYFLIPWIA